MKRMNVSYSMGNQQFFGTFANSHFLHTSGWFFKIDYENFKAKVSILWNFSQTIKRYSTMSIHILYVYKYTDNKPDV